MLKGSTYIVRPFMQPLKSPLSVLRISKGLTQVFIGPAALFQGVTTVPAKPGDVVLFFGTGFGPTNPTVAPGKEFIGAARLIDNVIMRCGGMTITPAFAGLSSSGLYQFNVTIPNLPNGEHSVEMQINSVSIQTGVVLTVQR